MEHFNLQCKRVDWWTNTFSSAIGRFGRTVMVLSPWHDPIPLTRAWCLFEIYCTVKTGSRFEVAMSASEREAFLTAMESDYEVQNRMLACADAVGERPLRRFRLAKHNQATGHE